ncbi:MAG TPA: CobW family GTP-binding protein [Draconibacterium sp.]|nr:CobW family GTP-binding protein [Draconibacterium sp.]
MLKKIPFHIVSGFLGSGKTTFLKRIIEQAAPDQKVGIIQNEFAPANIDGVELKKTGKNFELLEINNGSVFCVCLLGNFTRSLEKFIDEHQPDIVIIEASGLSDTTSIAEVISAGELSEKIYLASNCCIVDAQNFSKVGLMKERVTHQLRMADVVVINKTDLAKDGIEQIEQEIKKMNPFAEIKQSVFCNIDFKLGNTVLNKYYLDNVQAMPRPDVNSMVIKTSRKVTREALRQFLEKWAPKSYRIKGFVKLKEGELVAVQCTFDSVEILDVENDLHPTELIALSDRFSLREWYRAFKGL